MSHGRRSGESLSRSRFSACSASGQAVDQPDRSAGAPTASSSNGGGLFSYLRTEIDSFVKGLSGKADVRLRSIASSKKSRVDEDCLPKFDGDEQDLPALPVQQPERRKRQKRSHEDTQADERERDLDLEAIQGQLGRRLANQGTFTAFKTGLQS